MAYVKTLVADSVVQRLIEAQGIYQKCNRAFDSLVRAGATAVEVPNLPSLIVKTAGTIADHADRKKTKTETTMVNVPLGKAVIPIADEILGQFESNGMLMKEFTTSAALTFHEYFDQSVVTEALTTTNTVPDFANLDWTTITGIMKALDVAKVPKTGRIIAISANLADDFYAIDVIKNAMAYNIEKLQTGQFLSVLGMNFYISALVPQATAKNQVVGFYGPAVAFILSRYMELKSTWNEDNLLDVNDLLCHFGVKLLSTSFAVKGKES
jgi:hypothetical protein